MKLRPVGSNQTEVTIGRVTSFWSYSTPVAAFVEGLGYFRTATKYSQTTSRHINKWLDGVSAQTVSQDELEALISGTNGPDQVRGAAESANAASAQRIFGDAK